MAINPKFTITLHLSKLIDEISSLREKIFSSSIKIAWKPQMQREAIIRNAMGSSAIEGFVLSLPEVTALAQGKHEIKSLSSTERAVFNYLAALRKIQKNTPDKLSNEFICSIHKIIAEGASHGGTPGNYRTVQNYIVDAFGQVVYKPPKPEEIPGLMDGFVEFVNTRAQDYLPVISSGIIHYEFVAIHPFVDGNGRAGRILGTWELFRRKFDTEHIFAIDDIIYDHKGAYYKALETVRREKEDLTHWLEFYVETVAESLSRAWHRIMRLPKTTASEALSLTPRQEKLINLLKDGDNLSAKDIAKSLRITVQGVHFILKPLLKARMLCRRGGKKTGTFGLK